MQFILSKDCSSPLTPPLKLEEVDLTVPAVKDGGVFNNQTPSEATPLVPLTLEGQFSSITPPLKLEDVDLTAIAVKDGGV